MKIPNPLLVEWRKVTKDHYKREKEWMDTVMAGKKPPDPVIDDILRPIKARHELVSTHAWAIPTKKALDAIKMHAPSGIVEIGAGTGYWARLLRSQGVLVMAYDKAPGKNIQATELWSPVEVGGPEKAALWPQLALMLCWPPYAEPMAARSLAAYKGDTLIYIGESDGGCTGDDTFHIMLGEQWEEIEYVTLPQWPGIHDGLYIYKRL